MVVEKLKIDWKAAVRTWEAKREKIYTEKEFPKMEEISEEQRKQNSKKLKELKDKYKIRK